MSPTVSKNESYLIRFEKPLISLLEERVAMEKESSGVDSKTEPIPDSARAIAVF